jgi:hypothetical protein
MRTDFRIAACCAFFLFGTAAAKPKLPPPPPAAPPPAASFPLKTTKTFDTLTAIRFLRREAGTNRVIGDRFGIQGRGPAITIRYDAAAGTYTVQDDLASASFGAANLASTSKGFENYAKTAGTVSDTLNLLVNARTGAPKATAPLQLSYLSLAVWRHTDSLSGDDRKTYIMFGFPTGAANMPRAGSASYKTFVTGTRTLLAPSMAVTVESEIGGSASLTANFATGAISTQLVLTPLGAPGSFGTFVGTGAIYAATDQFGGTFASSTNPNFLNGGFYGSFYGPGAKEVGYGFYTHEYNPDPYAGAAPAPMYVLMTGSVVGTKN